MPSPSWLLSLLWLPCAFSSPTKALTTLQQPSPLPHPYPNTSSPVPTPLIEPVDPRFTIEIAYGTQPFNSLSCLMTIVNVLSILADVDYHGQIRELHYTMVRYPDIAIDIQPVGDRGEVENRLVVWGLYYGVKTIVEDQMSIDCEVALYWDEQLVALLSFKGTGIALPMILNDTLSGVNSSVGSDSAGSNISSINTGLGVHFHAPADAPSLSYLEVFVTIMATLKDLAQFGSTQYMGPFVAGAGEGYDANINFAICDPPRTRPPYFQVRSAIEAVRQMPNWILERGRWCEVGFYVMISEAFVGSGALERGGVAGVDGVVVVRENDTKITVS